MEWLSQNWIWLALGIGMVIKIRRGGAGGCCGGGHGADDKHAAVEGSKIDNVAAGGCCGGGAHGADDKHPETEGSPNAAAGTGHRH